MYFENATLIFEKKRFCQQAGLLFNLKNLFAISFSQKEFYNSEGGSSSSSSLTRFATVQCKKDETPLNNSCKNQGRLFIYHTSSSMQ
jgi:hypothetical protein